MTDWRQWLTAGERARVTAIDAARDQLTSERQQLMNRAKQRRHRGTMPTD